jgi:hypothetical protein
MIRLTKNDPNFELFKFVAKALRKGERGRDVLKYLFIEDNCIIATDGHRLHFVEEVDNYLPGFYQVIQNNAKEFTAVEVEEEGFKFPDWRKIVDQEWVVRGEVRVEGGNASGALCGIARDLLSTQTVDYNYLKDALITGLTSDYLRVVEGDGSQNIIKLKTGNRVAIIALMMEGE